MAWFSGVNLLLQEALAQLLPQTPLAHFLVANALVTLVALSILCIILFLLFALFLDFITDAWKLPFAAGVDVLKFLGLSNPWLAGVGALAGLLVFLFLSDVHGGRWLFALLSATAAILTYLWGGLIIGVLIALIPINTIMMFIATIID